jgi:DNA-binding GntR family transcriptional regulator
VPDFRVSTLRDRIYDEVVRQIVAGELRHGEQIDERVMSERLSVSRTPLREAFGALAKDGFVEIRPYRGAFVREFSPHEINDIFEVRKALECLAIRFAIGQMTDADVADIRTILDGAVDALFKGDFAAYAARDREFHERIAQLSDNHVIVDTLNRLALQIQACRVMANQQPGVPERTAQERTAILHALESRDAAKASALMNEHIAGVQRSIMDTVALQGAAGQS